MRPTGHIRERSPGSWELRYSLGVDSATGKRRTVTTTVRGKRRDAEKELRRRLGMVDTGEHVDPTRMTLRTWLAKWLDAVQQEVSPRTYERYGEIVKNFLIPALGNLALIKLTPSHIQEAYNRWAKGGRLDGKYGGLSALTRRYIHVILKSALTRAVEQQLLARNPADAFKKRLPKVERKEMVTFTAEGSERLLETIKDSRTYWPVLVALATGMRRGEILAIRWKNVDLDRGVPRVVRVWSRPKPNFASRIRRPAGTAPSPFRHSQLTNCVGSNANRPRNCSRWASGKPARRLFAAAPMVNPCSRAASLINSSFCETG
jgi:integrase